MIKFWALFALMTFAVKSASSVKKWTHYKAEYACNEEERRSSRETCELGPHAYRGTKFEGPAWSVKFFFDDPQLFVESPWYDRMRRDAKPLPQDVTTTLVEAIHMYNRDPRSVQSFGYRRWDGRANQIESPPDNSLNVNDESQESHESHDDDDQVYETDDYDDNSLSTGTEASDNRFIVNR